MQKLTDRQRMVLEFICDSIDDCGYPPTLREIGMKLGIRSTNGVNDHLRALERKGYLTREDMKSRTLRPTPSTLELVGRTPRASAPTSAPVSVAVEHEADEDLIEIPIVGRVAAGALHLAVETAEDSVRIDRMMLGGRTRSLEGGKRGDVFGLRVRGDSMIEAGIHDGDYVFVRKELEVKKGAIVVAMVGDEATCKYYFPEASHIRLQPANRQYAPILVSRNDWRETQILGVVAGVYRKL